MKTSLCLIVISFLATVSCSPINFQAENISLTIDQGTLFGKQTYDALNGSFYSFEGVPFAKPPVGELRFKAPEPAEPWTGVYDATKVRPICSQLTGNYSLADFEQSEDCLFLNVHTKMSKELKPVMVLFHGGGLEAGSIYESVFGPEFIMTEDVVLVKIAYRLSILGFLSINDPKYNISGNAGFKDQVMGLKWVKKNIHHFGGDPNQVTIFGESAGGASTHLLYLSPMADGLFHRAIVQSGAADSPWLTSPNKYPELAAALSCDLENLDETVKCLQSTSAEDIFHAYTAIKESDELNTQLRTGEVIKFNSVTIENEHSANSFLVEPPEHIVKTGKFSKVPIIMGFTSHEGDAFAKVNPVGPNVTDFRSLIPKDVKIDLKSEEAYELGTIIKEFYYGEQTPSFDVMDPYIDYLTDILFAEKIFKFAKLQSIHAKDVPLYFYHFDYYTKLNVRRNSPKRIVTHADDLRYLFYDKNRTPENLDKKSEEYVGIYRMVKLWTTFATSKNANPNPENDPLLDVKWLPVETNKFNYLKISQDLELKQNPFEQRMKFWEDVYKKFNKN